jgi:hypothetical protein
MLVMLKIGPHLFVFADFCGVSFFAGGVKEWGANEVAIRQMAPSKRSCAFMGYLFIMKISNYIIHQH